MKSLTLLASLLILSFNVGITQINPNNFNYQGYATLPYPTVVDNVDIEIEIGEFKDGVESPLYKEKHTNVRVYRRIFNLLVGNGEQIIGSFEDINWRGQSYYIKSTFIQDGKALTGDPTPIFPVPIAYYSQTTDSWKVKNSELFATYPNVNIPKAINATKFQLYDEESGKITGRLNFGDGDGGGELLLFNENEKLGFQLDASNPNGNAILEMRDKEGTRTVSLTANESNTDLNGAALKLYNEFGHQTIELDANNGTSGVGRVITDELEIRGGSDIAEKKNVISYVDGLVPLPGMVVSIDDSPDNVGGFKISDEPNDKKVAGIISGANGINPGLILSHEGTVADGEFPVAIAGQVYAFADASEEAIEVGDLLATSEKPGFVKKIPSDCKIVEGVVGKAMTKLGIGHKGLLLILIK